MSRKRISDYFQPYPPVSSVVSGSAHVGKQACSVPGLSILNTFITKEEEAELLSFLDAQQWRTDLSRRTMHYGGTYCLMPPRDAPPDIRHAIERNIICAPKIPDELGFLLDRMTEQGLFTLDSKPEYCIVNEYLPGQGISAHVENFRFGEPVCSLTLAGADDMRFHQLNEAHDGSVRSGKASAAPRTGRKTDVRLDRLSLVVLRGDARSKWQHEIVRGRKSAKSSTWRRVSLTFRTEKRNDVSAIIAESATTRPATPVPMHLSGHMESGSYR